MKQAATERVFGFEIMPAPFVVAHLQVGLTMQDLDAPLSDDAAERAGVFLTNALTGWEPTVQKPLPFPELEEERDRADRVKQDSPILVILGNPPYNGFAGMAVDEERELSTAYRTTKRVRRPEGQGLNDLYIRFFRMAERRIAEKTGRGVVCFISNYSWLDGLSFTGMRERYLEAFDEIRIDNLHGDRIISEYAPDGRTSETVMAIRGQSPGIKVGTAITLLSKFDNGVAPANRRIRYRDFHQARADERRQALLDSLGAPEVDSGYSLMEPNLQLGLPFKPMAASEDWHDWPALPDLFPVSFPGVKTSRDSFLVDVNLDRLKARLADYFNPDLSHEEIARRYPTVMNATAQFDARSVRDVLLRRGGPVESGFVRHGYRPFDNRWLYWEAETKLVDRPRADYKPHVFEGNLWFSAVPRLRRDATEPQVAVTSHLASLHLNEWSASMFPAYLRDTGLGIDMTGAQRRPNLSPAAQLYLERLGANVEDLFHHVIAVLHDPAYRETNAGALRMEWPRIPLPGWPDGDEDGAADELAASAARGRKLAALLDSDTPVPGVTEPLPGAPAGSALRPEIAAVAVPSTTDGGNMTGEDFALTAGWGHFGQGEAVMPGQGRVVERPYTAVEHAALGEAAPTLGDTTSDPSNRAGTGNPTPTSAPPVPTGHVDTSTGNPTPTSAPPVPTGHVDTSTGNPPPTSAPPVPIGHVDTSTGNPPPTSAPPVPTGHVDTSTGNPPPTSATPVPTDHADDSTGNPPPTLGDTTFDIYLNDRAYWRNVPAAVWTYKLGGYQVLKKWLSYRERTILDRPLKPKEVQHFTNTARRITAILLLTAGSP